MAVIRLYIRRRARYVCAANEFYVAANRLIDTPETPDDVLDFIEKLNYSINPYTALVFVRVLQSKEKSSTPRRPPLNLRTMPPRVSSQIL
ncbi:hypothetical protein [Mesorhizobium sp. A556]